MGSLGRKIKRKQRMKAKKHNKKNLQRALNAFAGMPSECTMCSEKFDETSDPNLWFIDVKNEMVSLYCPSCNPGPIKSANKSSV